ncbi:MAG: divalent cation tolerance protein CutA [Proteobacteria bacterium]|nr:divalent cation tolerance protein CutA [Pseudomonadota bacterium]
MAKRQNQGEFVVILVTVSSQEEGLSIARSLVDSRLAACVNIISGLRSIYRWTGKIWDEDELLLLIKTQMTLFEQVEAKVKEIHSYEVPEIITIPIPRGSETYLNWLRESTLS